MLFHWEHQLAAVCSYLCPCSVTQLFGAAVTCRIRISEKFYGTGESFLFEFKESGELKVFPWTGLNNYVVKGNSDSFSIGSGE